MLFTHLVRLLFAAGNGTDRLVLELDRRYALLYVYVIVSNSLTSVELRYYQISTFGRGTIRRFPSNVSEMKKLAARDFEDILQVCITYIKALIKSENISLSVQFQHSRVS